MKTLFKIYSMSLLAMHMVCVGSAQSVFLGTKTIQDPFALSLMPVTYLYTLVNGNSSACAQGYGIIQVAARKYYTSSWGLDSEYIRGNTSYLILYDSTASLTDNAADRLQRYKDLIQHYGALPTCHTTVDAAQQVVAQWMAENGANR